MFLNMFSGSFVPMRCRKFEARLEDYLDGAPDPELERHQEHCPDCRSALEDSRLAGNLMRQAWEPSSEARPEFFAGVMARIREQKAQQEVPETFWRPLEFLASRLALTAAVLLLALSTYLVGGAPGKKAATLFNRTEISADDLPQPPSDPVSNEEVLLSLAERNNGR